MRDDITKLRVDTFLAHKDYQHMQIWDLKYISTSDEEDNDSSESESSSEGEDSSNSDEHEEKKEESGHKAAEKREKETMEGLKQIQIALERN